MTPETTSLCQFLCYMHLLGRIGDSQLGGGGGQLFS